MSNLYFIKIKCIRRSHLDLARDGPGTEVVGTVVPVVVHVPSPSEFCWLRSSNCNPVQIHRNTYETWDGTRAEPMFSPMIYY